jgi:DnaJ-class molecular chaperone
MNDDWTAAEQPSSSINPVLYNPFLNIPVFQDVEAEMTEIPKMAQHETTCKSCEGSGQVNCPECYGDKQITCRHCAGAGTVPGPTDLPSLCPHCNNGRMACEKCRGTGKIPCVKCNGRGQVLPEINT